jgi:hypothetical protein
LNRCKYNSFNDSAFTGVINVKVFPLIVTMTFSHLETALIASPILFFKSLAVIAFISKLLK